MPTSTAEDDPVRDAAAQVRRKQRASVAHSRRAIREDELLRYSFEGTSTPKHEALAIWDFVERGIETLESARALIGMSDHARRVLTAVGYSRSVTYRDAVAVEFEALVREVRR